MAAIREEAGSIYVGARFSFRLERTLRVPDDGRRHRLPPSFGPFPVHRFPSGKFFVPVRQWEALWISFEAAAWKPNAVQVNSGGVNVLTGEPATRQLHSEPQNYLVCPDQPWLDGFKTATGAVRQFVVTPLGQGLTVEEQLTGTAEGGLSIRVIEPKRGRFPARRPAHSASCEIEEESILYSLGMGAGGSIQQDVYPDTHGLDTWDPANDTTVEIALVDAETFRRTTGNEPPPSPISAADYTRLGFPWFEFYAEGGDVGATPKMRGVRSLQLKDEPLPHPPVVTKLKRGKKSKEK